MYRAAVIGLGWMGLLYDLASRIGDRFEIDDIDRPTPPLDIHRKFHHYDHPGDEGNPTSYAEALWDRPEVEDGHCRRPRSQAAESIQRALWD